MKPASFAYTRPADIDAAIAALAAAAGEVGGEARVLADGLSLGPMLNVRVVRPALLVDIGRIGRRSVSMRDFMKVAPSTTM